MTLKVVAQNPKVITGRVVDADGWGIEYANVAAFASDSALTLGTVTDNNGNYTLNGIAEDSVRINISHISYYPVHFKQIITESLTKVSSVTLKKREVELPETVIYGNKKTHQSNSRYDTYNVTQDALSKINTTTELFNLVPSVYADPLNNIEVDGKSNVLILLNGRLFSEGNPLKLLTPNQIDRIEVLKTPPTKYSGEGYSSVINIVLKRELKQGYNGNLFINAPNKVVNSDYINLNYNIEKFRLYTGYNFYRQSYEYTSTTVFNSSLQANNSIGFANENHQIRNTHNITLGADIFANSASTFNISGKYTIKDNRYNGIVNNSLSPFTDTISEKVTSGDFFKELNINSYYQYLFKNSGGKIQFEYGFQTLDAISQQDNLFLLSNTLLSTSTDYRNNSHKATIDYQTALFKNFDLTTGVRFIKREFDNKQRIETLKNVEMWDSRGSLFVDLSGKIKKVDWWTGVSLIQYDREVNLTPYSNLRVIPNFGVGYKLNSKTTFTFSYSQNHSSPNYWQLDPYTYRVDSTSVRMGNPLLDVSVTNFYDISYSFLPGKQFLKFSLYYETSKNSIVQSILYHNSLMVDTYTNSGEKEQLGFRFVANLKITDWWQLRGNIDIYNQTIYNQYRVDKLLSSNLTIYSFLNFKYDFSFQQQLNFKGKYLLPYGSYSPPTYFALYLNKKILKKKGTLSLTFVQPFLYYKIQQQTNHLEYNYSNTLSIKLFTINMGFSYIFESNKNLNRKARNSINWIENVKNANF
jgi:outer membrane receptor protein involved in Fe transport